MSLLNDDFMPTDADDEQFLSELPAVIIQNSIRDQFEDPIEYRKRNYIQTYREKYEFTMEYGTDDDVEEAEKTHDEFIKFVINLFDEYLGIGFRFIDERDADDQLELLEIAIHFFIRNMRKNFTNLIMNYLDSYDDVVDALPNRSDFTFHNYTNEGVSEKDVKILSNIHYVVTTILDKDYDVDEFFELIEGDDYSLEYDRIKREFDEYTMTGNFVSKYVEMCMDERFISTLETRVRRRILEKYPYRKSMVKLEENKDNE